MTYYEKYLRTLKASCSVASYVIPAITQAPYVGTKEEIDARIKAIEAVVNNLQDAKRTLLYFKHKLGGPNLL